MTREHSLCWTVNLRQAPWWLLNSVTCKRTMRTKPGSRNVGSCKYGNEKPSETCRVWLMAATALCQCVSVMRLVPADTRFSLPHILLCRTDFSKHNQVFNSGVKMSTRAILFILAEMRIKLLYNRMPNTRSIFATYFKVDQLWSFQAWYFYFTLLE